MGKLLAWNNSPKIYCIGDSHVSFFSGQNKIQPLWPAKSEDLISVFKTYRLGAVLAYNLKEYGTRLKGREALSIILDRQVDKNARIIPEGSIILFCFGEIDARAHLLRQSQIQKRKIEYVVRECAERYFDVVKSVKNLGYIPVIWNAIPSTRLETIPSLEFPVVGTCLERNYVTKLLNSIVESFCHVDGIAFISIFEDLLDKNGLTNMDYYMDNIHLSQKAMPLALKQLNSTLGNEIIPSEFLNPIVLQIKKWHLKSRR